MDKAEEEFDSEEFHSDFFGKLVDAAKSGRSQESAWQVIGKYVDWVEQTPGNSPVVKYFADFLGGLLEVEADARARNKSPSKNDLAAKLSLLGIVQGRGQPPTSADSVQRRLAAVALLTRPTCEGGNGLSDSAARERLEDVFGLGSLRLRDLQRAHPHIWCALLEMPTAELTALVEGDESEKSLISH